MNGKGKDGLVRLIRMVGFNGIVVSILDAVVRMMKGKLVSEEPQMMLLACIVREVLPHKSYI